MGLRAVIQLWLKFFSCRDPDRGFVGRKILNTQTPIVSVCLQALTLALLLFSTHPLFGQVESTRENRSVDETQTPDDDQKTDDDNPGGEIIDEYPLADLPALKRIVLYNSGVGQLQHEGKAVGKQRFEIKFSAHDVDDVLKSLVFSDAGGGVVRAVEYQPAPEPEDVAANTVGMPMTLAQLIQRFRGESMTLSVGNFEYSGTIYGVENRTEGEETREIVVLISDDGLQSIVLATVDRIQFDNEELRQTLNQAMKGLVRSRKANQKKLELLLDGQGERDIRFAYVVDMPIWRMTYRLSIKRDKVYLQGWAHVDNVTGVDWEQVALELRSGKPQSFHINVFAPLMAERPDFGNAVYEFTEGLILVTQWFGFEPPARFGSDRGSRPTGGGRGGGFGGGGGRGRSAAPGVDIESAFRQTAQESRTAQMVRYVLDKPVDLGAGRSAALPVFSNEIPARLISVFDETDDGTTPFRAVEVTNATDLSIVSGPVSIMRDGDFVGDGKLGRLDVDQKAEVVYGVDRAVEIIVDHRTVKPKLVSVTLDERGGIVLRRKRIRKTIFRINNRDTESRHLVLYCLSPGHEKETLTPIPESSGDDRVRYVVPAEGRSQQEFEVAYERIETENKMLNGANARILQLDDERNNVEIPDDVTRLLSKLIELDARMSMARFRREQLNTDKADLAKEQTRVRDNLKVLIGNADAAKPFLDKLQLIEEQIEAVNREMVEKQEEVVTISREQTTEIKNYFSQ